ncbi:MAG: twin-arginine translocation signal domain-containing protein [Deltaproteobacteria bacterium]|nr:twin-arginine translocation signal domain-containing protein [Deltaproteobacteria bacterium]MBM4323268.1 twin-arginine translocation signal domain-containing protein [Deltaproteobacteria bacterium]
MAKNISRRRFLKNAVVGGVALGTGLGSYRVTYGQAKKPAGPIKIGGQGAISGAHADYGWQMMAGATLAIEEVNAKGGILGRKLEMKFMDEELKPATAVKNARYLVTDWGADFLFGVDSSGSAMALGPVLAELNRLHFFCHAATHRLTEELVAQRGIPQIFRMVAPVYQDALAAWVFKDNPEIKRWAGINCDYEYGYVAWNLFKENIKKFRPDVEFVAAAWAPFWTMDFSSHIAAVMAEKPDAIFATPWAGEGVMLLRQALMLGVFDKIHAWWQGMGGSVDLLEGLSREIEGDKFKGKLWATARYIHNYPVSPENKAFVDGFRKRWGKYPNYSAEASYSTIYTIKAGAEKAKSLDREKVGAALEGIELKTPAGVRLIRKADHQAVYTVPAGRATKSPDYTIPILSDLRVIPANEYFRHPPFTPVAATK